MSKALKEYTKEELIQIIKDLKRRKKFGLVWEEKPEDIVQLCETKLPVITEVSDKTISAGAHAPTNIIIEGDNYHSLSVLNYTHAGKIDVIYIDPPYNTGSNNFIFNDRYIDKEDAFRHSKWLSFMSKRLKLAKSLLQPKGLIFISIDDHEHANLKLLCDSIFEDNFLGTITWEKRSKAQNTKTANKMLQSKTEYILVYTVATDRIEFTLEQSGEKQYNYEDEKGLYRFSKIEEMSAYGMRKRETMIYPILGIEPRQGFQWKLGKATVDGLIAKGDIELIDGKPHYKIRPKDESSKTFIPFWSHFLSKDIYGTAETGKKELTLDLGDDAKDFETVKPLKLIKKLLFHVNMGGNETVLDFFAGSGTTGLAVRELNQNDGGRRRFIMCTNNENDIADTITYPRISKAIQNHNDKRGGGGNHW